MGRRSAAAGGDERGGAERPLVLVIEDNEHDWEIYGKVLWYNGFDVLLARTGEEGLALIEGRRPGLVLLDLVLPGMSGIEVSRHLRANPETATIPVVVLSAQRAIEHSREAAEMDCVRYLEKPISPLTVLHVAEEVLGRPPLPGNDPDAAGPPDEDDPPADHGSAPRRRSFGEGRDAPLTAKPWAASPLPRGGGSMGDGPGRRGRS